MLAREIKIPYDDDDDDNNDKNKTSNEPTICSEDCACDFHK